MRQMTCLLGPQCRTRPPLRKYCAEAETHRRAGREQANGFRIGAGADGSGVERERRDRNGVQQRLIVLTRNNRRPFHAHPDARQWLCGDFLKQY